MIFETIIDEKKDRIATLTRNCPNTGLVMDDLDVDETRVLIIKATGNHFSTGYGLLPMPSPFSSMSGRALHRPGALCRRKPAGMIVHTFAGVRTLHQDKAIAALDEYLMPRGNRGE